MQKHITSTQQVSVKQYTLYDKRKYPTIVCRIMIWWTHKSLRAKKWNKSWNVALVNALTFCHHIQLHQPHRDSL